MSIRRLPPGFAITGADPDEIPALIAIDAAATGLFAGTGLLPDTMMQDTLPPEALITSLRQGHLHCARDHRGRLAGFVMTSVRGAWLYIDQISVAPEDGRRGIGGALIGRVLAEARDRRLKKVTLSTFRDLPWNGPFYRRHGFRELPRRRMEKWMIEIESAQDDRGLDLRSRCFMARSSGWL